MEDSIIINGKPFFFNRLSWKHEENSVVDISLAKECLTIAKQVFDDYNITAFLLWGTLLGAIRDNAFISHDYDVDLGIMNSDLDNLENVIPELYDRGIKLCRYKKGIAYSFDYKGIPLDIDVIRKAPFPYCFWLYSDLEALIPKKLFKGTDSFVFYGIKIQVPHDPVRFLEYAYGKNWRIPQKGVSGKLMPDWMLLEKFYYKVNRKLRYMRFKYLGIDDRDFY